MWIQFAFDAHRVNANSIRIQTESSVKGPLEYSGSQTTEVASENK